MHEHTTLSSQKTREFIFAVVLPAVIGGPFALPAPAMQKVDRPFILWTENETPVLRKRYHSNP